MTPATPKPRAPRIKAGNVLPPEVLAKVEDYIARSVPEKHKLATERALKGMIPRSTAIRVKCLQCSGYQREEIALCTVITCALHPVRPYQPKPL